MYLMLMFRLSSSNMIKRSLSVRLFNGCCFRLVFCGFIRLGIFIVNSTEEYWGFLNNTICYDCLLFLNLLKKRPFVIVSYLLNVI